MDDGDSSERTNFIYKIKGFMKNLPFHEDDVTEEEIISMVNEGHEQGVLLASEAEMIHNIFEFGDKEAKDIMTPRKSITAIDADLSFNEAIRFINENNKSRYPVYQEDIDHVIGVLHIKDVLQFVQRNEIFRTSIKDIKGLIREAEFVPETLAINLLFKKMQTSKTHMYLVVDEYGQTSGLVALEDILEEIVGNIEDEHDVEESLIRKNADESFTIDGLAKMDEVIEALQLEMEPDEFDTLNGFLITKLEKIPSEDERVKIQFMGYDFNIQKVEDKMIRVVRVKKSKAVQE